MITHKVDTDTTLDAFLQTREQPWRHAILLASKGITIKHAGGKSEVATARNAKLVKGDEVTIADEGAPWKALTDAATKDHEDLFFCPGNTTWEKQMAKTLAFRPQMRQVGTNGGTPADLSSFIEALVTQATQPIRNLYVIAHGSTRGNLELPQRPTRTPIPTPAKGEPHAQDGHVVWEGLLEAQKDKHLHVGPRAHVMHPRPQDKGAPVPTAFHIKGCRLGIHQQLLTELKKALGQGPDGKTGFDIVTAPKFYQGASNFNLSNTKTDTPDGVLEFLMHEFTLFRPIKFATRDALLSALHAEGFIEHDGAKIERKRWAALVPKDIHSTPDKAKTKELEEADVIFPITGKKFTAKVKSEYEYSAEDDFKGSVDTSAKPTSEEDAIKALMAGVLKQRTYFSDTHAFPVFKRLGYASLEAMVRGYGYEDPANPLKAGEPKWYERGWDATTKRLSFKGIRHVYIVRTHLTQGASGKTKELIINFWPTDKKNAARTTVMIKETDGKLFGVA